MLKLLQKSAENLIRNWVTTLPTIIVIAIILSLFHGLLVVHDRAKTTLQNIQEKFSITVYLRDDADPFAVGNLMTTLEERSDVVKPVIYTSKEEAWKLMGKTFSLDNELLKKYNFSLPASLTITPRDINAMPAVEAFISSSAQQIIKNPLSSKEKQKNVTSQMAKFIRDMQDTTLSTIVAFIILFVIGGALLFSNTIHLSIASRHLEINIMKLVGASRSKISAPFVTEGALLGLASYMAHVALILLLRLSAGTTPLNLNALVLELLATMLLATSSAYFTVQLHIHKKHL